MEGKRQEREEGKKVKEPVEKGSINILLFLSPLPCNPHSPTAPSSVILATVNSVVVRCCAELFAVSHTLALVPIKIGTSGTPLTYTFTGLIVENLWVRAVNVLWTPALAAGWVYFEGTFAALFTTLTVTRCFIEKPRRKTKQWLTLWFALTVKFISDTQMPYTNWEPYNQPPAIEAPEY